MNTHSSFSSASAAASRARVVVIGAGIAGILAGIRLLERGIGDLTIVEKAETLGGTWRDNVYPGVACDVPAHLYSYTFEPNPAWTQRFASGPELWDYFDGVAEKYDVVPHVRYGTEVVDARWDGAAWTLTTQTGEELVADIVITAVGRLHHPNQPTIPGLEDFAGTVMHTAHWDTSLDLTGKRVGVVGTGSSATQLVSATAGTAAHLDLFQRTAQWVLEMSNDRIPWWRRLRLRLSRRYAIAYHDSIKAEIDEIGQAAKGDEGAVRRRNDAVKAGLARVRDPELRAKLTPDYEIGCKRLVISGTFYDAVQRPNVDVVTDDIQRVEAGGVRTGDGVLHELDVLALATGFQADSFLRPMTVTGRDGVDLDQLWSDVPMNYKSVALPGMPNFFMINGPFSPGGSASVLSIIETHVRYVMKLVDKVLDEHVALEPDHDRSAELLAEIRDRASKTVWGTGGCTSWYLDKSGVPLVNPLLIDELEADMAEPDYDDFHVAALTGASA